MELHCDIQIYWSWWRDLVEISSSTFTTVVVVFLLRLLAPSTKFLTIRGKKSGTTKNINLLSISSLVLVEGLG